MKVDVAIIGGGLTGSALAVDLGRRGLAVALCDRADFPRDKACGEGLLADGVAQLGALGLHGTLAASDAQPLAGIVYYNEHTRARGDFSKHAQGFGVRRLRLDAALHAAAARTDGVTVLRGEACLIAVDDKCATVTLRDGRTIRARALVGADGPRSFVRHALSLDLPVRGEGRYALRRHFRLAPGTPLPTHVQVSFHGPYELYVTPVAPEIVGVTALCARRVMQGGEGSKADRLARLWSAAPEALRALLDGAEPESDALACGPLRVRARAVSRGAALLVGDAGGYVDAITGEGMSLGLRSAAAAARALERWIVQDDRRAFLTYAAERAALLRAHVLLTSALVGIAGDARMRRRLVRGFALHPDTFGRWLAVSHGERTLSSLPLRDFWRLAAG
ncbi:MAG: FAD-dependent monooxygenase [Deltaproteobacteria bacterium]|nr:FAD-dependent monooxygenase [Deltaproteobacteria bacterium]